MQFHIVIAGLLTHYLFHVTNPSTVTTALWILGPVMTILTLITSCYEPFSLGSVFYDCATFLLFLSLSIVVYRISPLHPLSDIPGPIHAKVSKIFGMWMSWTGRQHTIIHDLHHKYGSVVRIGPNDISVIDVDAVASVLGAGGLPKGQYYEARQDPNAPKNLIVLTGEEHANRRRLWNRGMSSESMKNYEAIITKRAMQLVDKFATIQQPVDIAAWIGYFTFDFMGDMAFGGGFEMIEDGGDKVGLWAVLERFAITASVVSHVPWAAQALQSIPVISRDLQRLRKFGVESATRRMQAGSKKKDLWYHLSDEAELEKEKPPVKNVVADGALAIIAGADTTASAMASLFYFLMRNSDVYARVREEIDSVFPEGEDPLDTSKHELLPYLNACINEALRLHPPVPTNGPRQVPVDAHEKLIAGYFIPPGTQVYIPPYSLHLDARYFSPSPDEFMPERWLDQDKQPNTAAFIPFSYGPANCVGRHLARQEMLMVLSLLLQRFNFRSANAVDLLKWPQELHDHFVTTRGPLLVYVEPRLSE